MLLKKIIKNLPSDIQSINIEGLSQDSRQIKKIIYFLRYREQNLMEKDIF